jgi:hypothetical protein
MDHDTLVEIPFGKIQVSKRYHLAGKYISEPGMAIILEKNDEKHTITYAMIHDKVSWDGFSAFTDKKRSKPVHFTDIEKYKKYYLYNEWTDETIYAIIIEKTHDPETCTYAQIHDAVKWDDNMTAYKPIVHSVGRKSSVSHRAYRSSSKGGKRKRSTRKYRNN